MSSGSTRQCLASGCELVRVISAGTTRVLPSKFPVLLRQMAAEGFESANYSMLTRNCNSFSNALIFRLTGNHAPEWLNRAARFGVRIGIREEPAETRPANPQEGARIAAPRVVREVNGWKVEY